MVKKKPIDSYLGEGSVSLILSSNDHAIRLPLKATTESKKQINDYFDAWTLLSSSKYKQKFLFNIHEKLDGEYLLVDKVKVEMNYDGFKKRYKACFIDKSDFKLDDYGKDELDDECNYCRILEINEDLIRFAYYTAEFQGIQDISPSNIVYVENPDRTHRWVLLDFALPIRRVSAVSAVHPAVEYDLWSTLGIPKEGTFAISKSISDVIHAGRGGAVCESSHVIQELGIVEDLFVILKQLCSKWKDVNK